MRDAADLRPGPPPADALTGAGGLPLGAMLVAGFALTILLWLAAGIDLTFTFRAIDREVGAMTDRFMESEQALAEVRTNVLLGAIDWRDSLLDSGEPDRTEAYLEQLRGFQAACAASLQKLRASSDGLAASVSLEDLAREVDEYWASVVPIVRLPQARRASDVRRILGERILPRRANVVRIVAHVQSLNRSRLAEQQRREAAIYSRSSARFLLTGGVTLLLSLAVGAFVTARVSRLERGLRTQLAANAAIAADLHRLSARLVRAQEDERRRIARELHDEVGQALTAVKLQLSVARRAEPGSAGAALDEARAVADSALQSVRQLSRLLHPPMLDDMGLAPALDWYLQAFADRAGVAMEFVHAGMADRPAPEVETCLFRVVQEATTNIAKHAAATACRVYLQRLPASVVLTVEDNGRGFDPGTARQRAPEGFGLMSIEERVADARGVFRLESAPGRGTRLTVELPAGGAS
ncbi:MAG TPA: sensor histidine kinase [Vicinamibacterales bacterium]|nr:sensor histidine kinase [Vicinamibacterales bacterium]HPW21771.1 sensor histidine kinase [Vicinamibacterales bacterium]